LTLHGLVAGRRAKRQDRALTREELAQPLGGAMREGVLDPQRPLSCSTCSLL
jgi:hypothetical protein